MTNFCTLISWNDQREILGKNLNVKSLDLLFASHYSFNIEMILTVVQGIRSGYSLKIKSIIIEQ
jgi:hypothetical protein